MKKLIPVLILCLIPIFAIAQQDLQDQLIKYHSQIQTINTLAKPNLNLITTARKVPYAMIYEHTGLYRWLLFTQCYYDYKIDSTAALKINIEYKPNDDLFSSIPAYFNLNTTRPSNFETFKAITIATFKAVGSSPLVLIDKADTSYNYPGHEYCLSCIYSGSTFIIYSKFIQVDDISCVIYYITAGTFYNNFIYKFFFDSILLFLEFRPFTSVSKPSLETPVTFDLFQNYPNPFNSSTKISYTISEPGIAKLDLFNLKGEYIKTIVNQFHQIGTYSIDFDLNFPSGLYFYRLSTQSNQKTHSMILIK